MIVIHQSFITRWDIFIKPSMSLISGLLYFCKLCNFQLLQDTWPEAGNDESQYDFHQKDNRFFIIDEGHFSNDEA